MTTLNLPKFGKIKIDGEWCDFHESSVITGTISDDCCEIKIEEFKPKMNTYKIISGETYPTLEKLMGSQSEVKSASLREACCEFMKSQQRYEFFGYFLHVETLDLFYVQYHRELNGREHIYQWHKGKIEKPQMNKYKILITSTKPNLEAMIKFGELVEAESAQNVYEKYFPHYCKLNTFRILNLSNLDLYSYTYNKHKNCISFCVEKLEKSAEKPMNNLSFKTLTEANNKRLPLFKNSKGLPAHSKPDGSDWSHAEWLQAVIGELGEYANIMKKVQRGDLTMEEAKPSIEKELADVMTYFAILAQQLNVDLGQAVEDKFNEVSKRVKANVFIKDDKVFSKDEKPEDEYVVHCDEYHSHSFERGCMIKVKKDEDKTRKAKGFMASDKEKLKVATDKVKVKPNAWSSNANYITNIYFTDHYYKDQIHKKTIGAITLQCLSSLRNYRYKQENMNIEESTILDAIGQDILGNNCKLSKLLINGNIRVNGYKLKLGDMIQFTDERNVLYSFRVTELL